MSTTGTGAGWMGRWLPRDSLARRTVAGMSLRIALVVLVATALSYRDVHDGMETQALTSLERYVETRRARENVPFAEAERSLDMLAAEYSQALLSDVRRTSARPSPASGTAEPALAGDRFLPQPDGTRRTSPELFARTGVTGFLGKHAQADEATRRRLDVAVRTLARFGPAWRGRFANAYVVLPEGAVVMFWPGVPWALENGDWEIFGKLALARDGASGGRFAAAAAATPAAEGPARARWSGLYFDYGANDWVVSVTRDVAVGAARVATVGHDLLLSALFDRILENDIPGAETMLVDADGQLIAHPRFMAAIQARGGPLPVVEAGDPHLSEIMERARALGDGGIAEIASHDEFVASTRLSQPGWYLITVFPERIVSQQATDVAALILGLGLIALLLEVALLTDVFRRQVGRPLADLARLADATRTGEQGHGALAAAHARRDDELGALARAFSGMTEELGRRETALAESNAELVRLNGQLEAELVERQNAERELERNRELNALLDAIGYGVLFLDGELNVRLANKAYNRIWQAPKGFFDRPRTLREDMQQSWRQGLYGIDIADFDAYCEERLAEVRAGPVPPRELALTSGLVLRYECFALPDGGRMLTYYDITELKAAERRLRHHLDGMEASMDGMALLDSEGRYVYVNSAHAEVYGYDRNDMIGLDWRELYDEAELARFDRDILPILGPLGRWRGEATGRRRTGRRFPQELSLGLTETGGIVCVVRDITERRRREEALDHALREAERSNAAKSRFLASMSHELRTPLNAIIGFSRLVARRTRGTIAQQQSENLEKIQISGEHLLRLINEVLDISKIEAGRMEVARVPFSPAGVIDECLRTIQPIIAPGVTLDARIEGRELTAIGDSAKVRQILINLLSNAARHTTEGHIHVTLVTGPRRFEIAVADTGSGIPGAMLERIFEEFGQAGDTSGQERGGTGLGLTISRRLARLMGGDVSVTSTPGVGSTFTLRLPRELPREAAARAPAEEGLE